MTSVAELCREIRLPDRRLVDRIEFIFNVFSRDARASVPRAFERDWVASQAARGEDHDERAAAEREHADGGGAKAAYRFFSNDRVDPEAVVVAQAACTARRVPDGGRVLVVQDTTSFDFTGRAAEGMGYLRKAKSQGFFMHTSLAVSPEDGTPLGVVAQKRRVRPAAEAGKRKDRNKKPTAAKESDRWLESVRLSAERLPGVKIVSVADREGDVYDLFVEAAAHGVDLLGRARAWNRLVPVPERTVEAAVRASEHAAALEVEVPRGDFKAARTAKLSLRWRTLDVPPPSNRRGPTVSMNFLLVEE